MRLAMAGDRNAQQAMYDQFSHRIYRLVQRMVGSSDAEDVAQNAFIQIFIKLDQFRNESSLETWIHRLAVNESLQFLRQRNGKSS